MPPNNPDTANPAMTLWLTIEESVDLYLRARGLLTITTDDILLWVDQKRGVMPLGRTPPFTFPPGF